MDSRAGQVLAHRRMLGQRRVGLPCVVRWTIHSTYAAARMMPKVAITATGLFR